MLDQQFIDALTIHPSKRVDAMSDIPYYMTVTVSGPSYWLNPESTDYAISLRVMGA